MKLGFVLAAVVVAAACGGSGADGNGPYCGDGVKQANEQCDDGTSNGLPGDPCSATCAKADTGCGDGVVEHGEECDDGSRNGPAPAECSTMCTFNEPRVSVSWKILAAKTQDAGSDSIGPCPWWPSGPDAPPAPSTTSIRLLAAGPGTAVAGCLDCDVATFDCADGSGSVRLPKGTYSFAIQPVQSTDAFSIEPGSSNANMDIEGDTTLTPIQVHQGGNLAVTWTDLTNTGLCSSMTVAVYSTTDMMNTPTDLQQVPVSDMVTGLPCSPGQTTLGPYPVVGPNLTDGNAEYSVVVTGYDLQGKIVESGAQTATILRSNSTTPVNVGLTLTP